MDLASRWTLLLPIIGLGIASAHAADASGTLNYEGRQAALKYAWLVTGRDDMAAGTTVRDLVLSANDIGAKLEACRTFSCTDGSVTEGMTVEFGDARGSNYWVALNGPKVDAEFDVKLLKDFKIAR